LPYITGCFALSAKDTAGNESEMSEMTCFDIDDCVPYLLPNVFTPDGDGINDFFTPFLPYYNVKSVNFTVYNRWGGVVFKTQNPDLNWNGENIYTKQPCTDGTYFYVCEVYLYSLKGIIPMPLHGTITIIRSK
jgi:gliding motility-associated-like protein